MKNIICILMLFPLLVCSQIRINGTSEIRVLEEGAVRVTGNTDVASGAQLSILGDYTTSGNLVNNGSASNVIVESNSAQTGSLIVEGSATGDIKIERYLTPSSWHFVSTSVTGISTTDFYFNQNPEVYASYWDEPNSRWPFLIPTNEPMPLGVGYKIWITEAPVTIEMEGSIQTSDLSVNLTNDGTSYNGLNLIGNPFSSEINTNIGNWGSNTDGIFYVWDSTYNGGDYRVWNGSTGDLTDGIIPISQSFFVYAESAGAFNIPKAAQTHGGDEFYKDQKQSNYVRLQLDANGFGNTLFIGFPDHGTSNIDYNGDAKKIYSNAETPQLYAKQAGEALCILADAPLNSQVRVIPLYTDQWINGDYTFTLSDAGGLAQMDIYLEDKVTGSFKHLSLYKTYAFSANANAAENRFNLHFSKKAIGLEELSSTVDDFSVYSRDHSIFIKSNKEEVFKNLKVKVYNINGQLIYKSSLHASNQINVEADLSTACYFVHLEYDQNTIVKKVIVKR